MTETITEKIDYENQDWSLAEAHKRWVNDTVNEQDDPDKIAHASRHNIPNRFRLWLAGDGLVADGRDVDYDYPEKADYRLPISNTDDLTIPHFRGWYKALHEHGWASSTIESYHTLLSMWVNWMDRKQILREDFHDDLRDRAEPSDIDGIEPDRGFKEEQFKEKIQYVTPEEVDKMCKHVSAPKTQHELLIRLMFQTGLREKEVRNIEVGNLHEIDDPEEKRQIGDIDRDERKISVITAKNGILRNVWYHEDLDVLMDKYIERDRGRLNYNDSPYLFPTNYSPQMARNTPNGIVTRCAEQAGIQDYTEPDASGKRRRRVTAHALRHGFGVQCAKNRMHIKSIQTLLGHKKIEQTKKYIQFTNQDVKEAYDHSGPMEYEHRDHTRQ